MATATSFEIQGRTISFPVEVRHASMANAVYSVDAEAVAAVVDDPVFEPAVDDDGRASVVVGFVDYVDNDLGDYDEVMLAAAARAVPSGDEGTYIWRLPVNQGFTCEAGVRMLGLPKTVEEITIDHGAEATVCTLRSGGELVLRQTVPTLRSVEPVPMAGPTVCLSRVEGVPSTASSDPAGSLRMAFDATGYELELGPHPWGRELAGLGLESATPTVITWCDDFRSVFHAPQPL